MPALPWSRLSEAPAGMDVVAMASRLPLSHNRHIPLFLRRTLAIRRQLVGADGLIGYALDADLIHKTFWTVSAWRDREALSQFNRANLHRAVVGEIRRWMQPPAFVFWARNAADLVAHAPRASAPVALRSGARERAAGVRRIRAGPGRRNLPPHRARCDHSGRTEDHRHHSVSHARDLSALRASRRAPSSGVTGSNARHFPGRPELSELTEHTGRPVSPEDPVVP